MPVLLTTTTVNRTHQDICLRPYNSLLELRRQLQQLDVADARPLTVVLVLDDQFAGHLPSLIARNHLGFRLVLTASTRLPGRLTIGDLAASSGALGWQQIVFHRDAQYAVPEALSSMEPGERFVLCWPDWHDERIALLLLQR